MNPKSVIVLISIFLSQTISSCYIGECDESGTYDVEYNGVTVKAWDTSGFVDIEVVDSVYKSSFGLSLSMSYQPRKVSDLRSFGFSSAFARSCEDDVFIFTNPIYFAEIYMTDIQSGKEQLVTELFGTYDYSGNLISVSERFATREQWDDSFKFELIDFDSIPNSVYFTVYVVLESGYTFSQPTLGINFYD